jgi:hypothetical protein
VRLTEQRLMVKLKTRKPEASTMAIDPIRVRDEAIRAVRIIIAKPGSADLRTHPRFHGTPTRFSVSS